MIIHQAVSVKPPALLKDLLAEKLEKTLAIDVIGKNVGSRIAARRQMIERTGKLKAQWSGHAVT